MCGALVHVQSIVESGVQAALGLPKYELLDSPSNRLKQDFITKHAGQHTLSYPVRITATARFRVVFFNFRVKTANC